MASTIRDVAARAGLSVATVSKYINGKTVKESTRLAIEEAIKELDFHPNNIAKGLCNAKSFSVAILLPMLDSTFCTSMISSIESTLLPLGYSVIVCECHNNTEMELRKTQYLIDRRAKRECKVLAFHFERTEKPRRRRYPDRMRRRSDRLSPGNRGCFSRY